MQTVTRQAVHSLLLLLLGAGSALAQTAVPTDYDGRPCEMTAVFTAVPPVIDGIIESDIWSRASLATSFTQREPDIMK